MTTRDWLIIAAAVGAVAFVWWYTHRRTAGALPTATVTPVAPDVSPSNRLQINVNPFDDLTL